MFYLVLHSINSIECPPRAKPSTGRWLDEDELALFLALGHCAGSEANNLAQGVGSFEEGIPVQWRGWG